LNAVRANLDELAVTLLACAQRLLGAIAFRNIDHDGHRADELARVVALGDPGNQDIDRLAAFGYELPRNVAHDGAGVDESRQGRAGVPAGIIGQQVGQLFCRRPPLANSP
jgi:hypothetical protein